MQEITIDMIAWNDLDKNALSQTEIRFGGENLSIHN